MEKEWGRLKASGIPDGVAENIPGSTVLRYEIQMLLGPFGGFIPFQEWGAHQTQIKPKVVGKSEKIHCFGSLG